MRQVPWSTLYNTATATAALNAINQENQFQQTKPTLTHINSTTQMPNLLQSDLRSALHALSHHLNYSSSRTINPNAVVPSIFSYGFCKSRSKFGGFRVVSLSFSTSSASSSSTASSVDDVIEKKKNNTTKPLICTADELHYVPVPNTDWKLALWRYRPPPQAPPRNRPLLLLSGVATNAIGFDLSPECSFARYMSNQGFDTWILEVRGAGLSTRGAEADKVKEAVENDSIPDLVKSADNGGSTNDIRSVEQKSIFNSTSVAEANDSVVKTDGKEMKTAWDESQLVGTLTDTFMLLSEKLSGFLSEGQSRVVFNKLYNQMSKLLDDAQLLECFNEIGEKFSALIGARQNSAIAAQVRDLSQRLVNLIEDGQRSVSEVSPLFDLQERFATTLNIFQQQLDLIIHYDWDFDNYLEEDVPAAMEYIRTQTKPKDGKIIAIGHSMGGILLYAMLSRYGFEGRNSGLAAIVTLGSSLDYTSSKSSLRFFLPLADPAQALNVPVIPLGALLAAAYPLTSLPPYALAWINTQISAVDMMKPELLKKLILNSFCTIPAKLLLQLATAFRQGGLRDRSGTFRYKDHLHKGDVPILALAGDQDRICPPEAVYDTVKIIPPHLVTYKLFGESGGPHYAHYDLVGGRMAINQVYPCIVEFIIRHDET